MLKSFFKSAFCLSLGATMLIGATAIPSSFSLKLSLKSHLRDKQVKRSLSFSLSTKPLTFRSSRPEGEVIEEGKRLRSRSTASRPEGQNTEKGKRLQRSLSFEPPASLRRATSAISTKISSGSNHARAITRTLSGVFRNRNKKNDVDDDILPSPEEKCKAEISDFMKNITEVNTNLMYVGLGAWEEDLNSERGSLQLQKELGNYMRKLEDSCLHDMSETNFSTLNKNNLQLFFKGFEHSLIFDGYYRLTPGEIEILFFDKMTQIENDYPKVHALLKFCEKNDKDATQKQRQTDTRTPNSFLTTRLASAYNADN